MVSLISNDNYVKLNCMPTACRGMFGDFAKSFETGVAQHELFEPLARYEQICNDNVLLLKSLAKRSVPSHARLLHFILLIHVSFIKCLDVYLTFICSGSVYFF